MLIDIRVRETKLLEELEAAGDGGLSAKVLGERLECSPKTAKRHIDLLIADGREISRKGGGANTVYALRVVNQSPLTPETRAGLVRLLMLFPALWGLRFMRSLLRLAAHVIPDAARTGMQHLRHLEEAIEGNHPIEFLYCNLKGEERVRLVQGYELRFMDGHVFLIARDLEAARKREGTPWRVFKVARIRDTPIVQIADTFRPVEYDPERFQASSGAIWQAESLAAVMHLSRKVAHAAADRPLRAEQAVEHMADGSIIVRTEDAGEQECMRWLLSWGAEATVLGPASLKDAYVERLTEMLKRHTLEPERLWQGD